MNYNISHEPTIDVGILLEQPKIEFTLHNDFVIGDHNIVPSGDYSASVVDGNILFEGGKYKSLLLSSSDLSLTSFTIKDVIIGVNFHWERKENQQFVGSLKLIIENNKLTAINKLSLEDYLVSVISSEMSATSSLELLKAHAVISRSWLMAQIEKNKEINTTVYKTHFENESETIRWFDREDHINFDVCADDHCQRYQGVTRQTTDTVAKVINLTRGEILTYNNKICDARFSKCCGGIMETFENVWEPVVHPYLQGKRDLISDSAPLPNLSIEEEADKWIRSVPQAFCNTNNKEVLRQVLNDYDQETADFYRWKVEYTQQEIKELIRDRSGIDYGDIVDLVPVERGTSGRLIRLKVIGSKRERVIGKELEIRRTLSPSHLYSSAFVVDKHDLVNNIPGKFTINGAGWGHGVGLCQIGAAEMAEEGFDYKHILSHYFPGSDTEKKY